MHRCKVGVCFDWRNVSKWTVEKIILFRECMLRIYYSVTTTVLQKWHSPTMSPLLQLLMTALISAEQQSTAYINCCPTGVRELQARMCTFNTHSSLHSLLSATKTYTPLTQQVLHKLLLPSSPHECTHAHTNLCQDGVAGVSFSPLRLYLITAGGWEGFSLYERY